MNFKDTVNTLTTSQAIARMHEANQDELPRAHLGASQIGKPCARDLWYSFRWATRERFSGRILRLFETGKLAESRFIHELRKIGATVHDVNPDTGKQFSFEVFGGHFGGSCDGWAKGLPEAPKTTAILEFKTHGDKSFNDLKDDGVEDAKPEHFVQVQVYMGAMGLTRALYLAVNKNTDELYSEWIHYNEEVFAWAIDRAKKVIFEEIPPRINESPTWYQCKMCSNYKVCHDSVVPKVSCRTCAFSTFENNGTVTCGKFKKTLTHKEQVDACESHLYIPTLIQFADAVDFTDDAVHYRCKTTGREFQNGKGNSRELEGRSTAP